MQKTKRYDDNALLKKDLFMTSVLLNRCGIIRGDTFVIIKFENEDNHVKTHLQIMVRQFPRCCFHRDHRGLHDI